MGTPREGRGGLLVTGVPFVSLLARTMGRSEVAAVVQHVLQQCGAGCLKDIADLLECDDGRAHILNVLRSDACCAAAAQAPVDAEAVTVTLRIDVEPLAPPPPPPPPPTVNAALQVTFPAVPLATVGTTTDSVSIRNAQAQTARWLYGTTSAVQTDAQTHSMVDGSTTTEGAIGMVDASTDHYLDRLWLGLVHSTAQTEVIGAVVAAADHEQLGAELRAAVEAASAVAEDRAAAAVDTRAVQTEVTGYEYEQLGAKFEALSSRAADLSAQAAEAQRKAAEDRVSAAEDRAVAAADREAAARDRDKHAGIVALQRQRLRAREHDWSTS